MKLLKVGACALPVLLLSSCFFSKEADLIPNSNPTNSDKVVEAQKEAQAVVKNGDTIAVDYVGRLEDGTVFDSSIASEAKKTKKYSESREYAPLVFTVGAGKMIAGFDKGVVGMKVGEKKTLTIPPEDAYGTGGTERTIDRKAFEDVFTVTVPLEGYKDTIRQPVSKKTFTDLGKVIPKVGETITAGSVSAKVVSADKDNIVIDIDNKSNPFYGKKLTVGLSAAFQGNIVKITKLTAKDITLEVTNKANPFFGKTIAVGDSAVFSGNKITIKKIEKENVTIEEAGELVGKTLTFDIEIKEIK